MGCKWPIAPPGYGTASVISVCQDPDPGLECSCIVKIYYVNIVYSYYSVTTLISISIYHSIFPLTFLNFICESNSHTLNKLCLIKEPKTIVATKLIDLCSNLIKRFENDRYRPKIYQKLSNLIDKVNINWLFQLNLIF